MHALMRRNMAVTRSMSRSLATMSTNNNFELQHKPAENRFVMKLNGDYANVTYEKENDVYDLIHSEIPDPFKGKGFGKILAEKTFQYIADNNLKAKVTCTFLKKHYNTHQDRYKQYIV